MVAKPLVALSALALVGCKAVEIVDPAKNAGRCARECTSRLLKDLFGQGLSRLYARQLRRGSEWNGIDQPVSECSRWQRDKRTD